MSSLPPLPSKQAREIGRIKRPRTDHSAPATDKKSTKKKSKKAKSQNKPSDGVGAAVESTATPEGHMMAQALSTFNALELSRFEAFRRCTFRGDAVSKYVAFLLAEHQERRFASREGTRRLIGGAGLGVKANSRRTAAALRQSPLVVDCRREAEVDFGDGGGEGNTDGGAKVEAPHLEDLVAPNTAQEITVVVSALAKCYAQRLVTAARRVASAEGHPEGARILPRHLLEAQRHRQLAGIDPGFFLQTPSHCQGMGSGSCRGPVGGSSACAAALGITDKNRLKFAAVQQAQEEYDRMMEEDTNEEEASEGG